MPHSPLQIFEDVACTRCGCVCDDLRVTVENGTISQAEFACELAAPWYAEQHSQPSPGAYRCGQPVPRAAAVAHAAAILKQARYPLIYGLSRSSTEGQRAAVALAERLRGVVDTTASEGHSPSILALQQTGEPTTTLGETRDRADLVVYWGANPLVSHPRHMERYAVEPAGRWTPDGAASRRLVVVDVRETNTTARANPDDVFVVEKGCDLEVLWLLRALVQDRWHDWRPTYGGIPLSRWQKLALAMRAARSGVVFFGYGLTRQACGNRVVESLLELAIELQQHTRFAVRRLRVRGDVAGADSVLCWQTGYPFSVSFATGFPRYNPGEFSAGDMLHRGEPDAVVLLGSDVGETFTAEARAHLRSIPVIALDHASQADTWPAEVRFTTAAYGVHVHGTAYRMDETPIGLRPILAAVHPSDEDVLREIFTAIG